MNTGDEEEDREGIKHLNHWDICSVFVENAGKPRKVILEEMQ